MVLPGLINLDFADVRTVMTEMGKAMMGTGEASGEGRALMAAENAIQNPLLDEVTLKGAKAVLVNITGGLDMTLLEVDEAANAISGQVDPEANIIFGAAFDPTLDGMVRVSVVATGMDGASIAAIEHPQQQRADAVRQAARQTQWEPELQAPPVMEPAMAAAAVYPMEPELEEAEPIMEPHFKTLVEPEVAQPDFGFDIPSAKPAPAIERAANLDADLSHEEEPLFGPRHFGDEPRQKGGWLSLFGRPRPEASGRQVPVRSGGGAQPALDPMDDIEADEHADLEIPSFLRRLAN